MKEYDFNGKTIIPFCSHVEGGWDSGLSGDVEEWLRINGIME